MQAKYCNGNPPYDNLEFDNPYGTLNEIIFVASKHDHGEGFRADVCAIC